MRFASFYPSRLLSNRKIYRPIFLHLAPKRQRLKHRFAPFCMLFQSVEALFGSFLHCILLHSPCVLVHFTLRFGAFRIAFWCVLHCVLVLNGVCFAAFYPAFWCILPHILLQKAWCSAQNVYLNRGKRIFIRLCTCPVLPQTSWRNTRKNVSEGRVGWKYCSHNVKFRAQNVTLPCRRFRQHHITSQCANLIRDPFNLNRPLYRK